MHKTLAGWAALGLVLAAAPAVGQERIDTSDIFVKGAIARTMTPDQLQAYKETLARRKAAGAFDRAPAGPLASRAPGDICTAATYEIGATPYGPVNDTTVGASDNYDLPPDTVNPTCEAPVTCTGTAPDVPGALPRGAIYSGTGTAPDRAFRIRTSTACNLTLTLNSSEDLVLILYPTTCSSQLSDCGCVSDSALPGGAETITLTTVANTSYFIVVDGYSTGGAPPGPSGPYTLTVTAGAACSLVPVELQGLSIE